MINVACLFHQRYRRELAMRMNPDYESIRVRSIVATRDELATVLMSTEIDVVVSGLTFAPGLPVFGRRVARQSSLMFALVSDIPSADARMVAEDHGFDVTIDLSGGIDSAGQALIEAFGQFRRGELRPANNATSAERHCVSAIHVAADSDKQIVGLIASGRSDREISAILSYSDQTIRNRVSKILQLSGLASRTQLATTYLNILHSGRSPFVVEEPRTRYAVSSRRH